MAGMCFGPVWLNSTRVRWLNTNNNSIMMRMQLILTAFCAVLMGTNAVAQDTQLRAKEAPNAQTDGTWVGVHGTVESTSSGSFVLDYGSGNIKVIVDPSATNPYEFTANEAVTVYGVIDEGFFKATTLRARTIHLDGQKRYACTTDGADAKVVEFVPAMYAGMLVHGRVSGKTATLVMVDQGDRTVTVDISKLVPVPNGGNDGTKVQEGDYVTVVGQMDQGLFSGRKFVATSMTVMH